MNGRKAAEKLILLLLVAALGAVGFVRARAERAAAQPGDRCVKVERR